MRQERRRRDLALSHRSVDHVGPSRFFSNEKPLAGIEPRLSVMVQQPSSTTAAAMMSTAAGTETARSLVTMGMASDEP